MIRAIEGLSWLFRSHKLLLVKLKLVNSNPFRVVSFDLRLALEVLLTFYFDTRNQLFVLTCVSATLIFERIPLSILFSCFYFFLFVISSGSA